MSQQRSTQASPANVNARTAAAQQPHIRGKAVHPILHLQRTIGNRAVQRMIASQETSGDYEQESATQPPLPEVVNGGLSTPGKPLDADVREFMEAGFGADFGDVRVHTDSGAAESSEAINAKAYTIGQDLVFGAGAYSPASSEGKKLIAHELTHVVQQSGATGVSGELEISHPEDQSERAAEDAAAQVMSASDGPTSTAGNANSIHQSAAQGSTISTVSRQGDDDLPDTDPNPEPSPYAETPRIGFGAEPNPGGSAPEPRIGFGRDISGPNTGPNGEPSMYGEDPTLGFGAEPGPGGLSDPPTIGFGAEPGPVPGAPPSLYGEPPTLGFGVDAGAGVGEGVAAEGAGAGAGAGLGTGAILPVALAGAAGVGAGIGMGKLADSDLTKTGAFGTNSDTGQNQSAMDWGASWGTSVDKALGNTDPSVLGGIAAGAGGIVGGVGGAIYGAGNWLADKI